jgi:hypothetical protein
MAKQETPELMLSLRRTMTASTELNRLCNSSSGRYLLIVIILCDFFQILKIILWVNLKKGLVLNTGSYLAAIIRRLLFVLSFEKAFIISSISSQNLRVDEEEWERA